MRINKVILKNYRIHNKYEVSFKDGINLLLGDNGSGKSSVLEAIGFALFGSDTRSGNGDIVSKGESSGSVKVYFTGNDEKEYEIEREFSSGSSSAPAKLTSSDSSQKWVKNGEVYRQIGKILQMDNIKGVFFESVICAKQNQFIDIFTMADGPRATHFNELFDTAIYGDLYGKLRDQNLKKYEKDKNDREIEKNTLAGRRKDIAELEKKRELENKELSEENSRLEIAKKELEQENNELDKYKAQKAQINSKEIELRNSKEKIKQLADTKNYFKRISDESQTARIFLEKNKIEFEKYEIARQQSCVLDKNLQPLRNASKYYEDLQKRAQASGFCTILNISCQKLAEHNGDKLLELKSEIEKAKQNKEKAEHLQSEINKIRTEILNPMHNIYQKCLEYKKDCDKYEERKNQLALSEKHIVEETKRIETCEKELNELKGKFSEDQLKLKDESVRNLMNKRDAVIVRVTSLKNSIAQIEKDIIESKELMEKIAKLDLEIASSKQKMELTIIFRDNVKDLGGIVQREQVHRIALIAGDYFSKITGRSELISWVCNEDENYGLYLDNGKNRRSFINLSGGEQISVAIAIRLALSQVFGNSGLIILDEPTNNLDKNKRQLLADNLPKMVENLNQLFVVTHDDTFRNTATNVIEFK